MMDESWTAVCENYEERGYKNGVVRHAAIAHALDDLLSDIETGHVGDSYIEWTVDVRRNPVWCKGLEEGCDCGDEHTSVDGERFDHMMLSCESVENVKVCTWLDGDDAQWEMVK